MRRAIFGALVAAPLLLTSCATVNSPGQLADLIAQVQAQTRQICAFVPVAADIANLLSAGSLTSVAALANAICSALVAKRAAARPGAHLTVVVNGVPVRGTRVRR